MTETPADGAPASTEPAVREIEFAGRKIWVKFPGPEQLLVWRRVLRQVQDPAAESWSVEQQLDVLERARKIIDSVLVDRPDREWLDDQMLDGAISFQAACEIILKTVKAFGADTEGEKKPTPARKATRRKAAPRG